MCDIIGIELLNQKLLQPIKDIEIESFIFNDEVIEVNTIYLKFDEWISLFFDDGVLFIKQRFEDKQRIINADGNIIEYRLLESINHLRGKDKIINSQLDIIHVDDALGLTLKFKNQKQLRINQQILLTGEFAQILIEIK